jgi:hypothetical protein
MAKLAELPKEKVWLSASRNAQPLSSIARNDEALAPPLIR